MFFPVPAMRILMANIGTYRDGEGCGIEISGYAPVMQSTGLRGNS
jgi:hypothetical protein